MFQMWPHATALRDKAEWENEEGFEAAIPFFADFVNCDERFLASYLALLSQGQISPQSLPWLIGESSAP
jgi:EAL domain-containing protein (putative c-di-GMP-specific phosphodiesterase class I)